MRIVLTHPYCWPYVRRGTERGIDVLARHLVEDGHEVVTVSTRPDGAGVDHGPAGHRIFRKPVTFPLMSMLRVQPTHTFFFVGWQLLPALAADVVHSFYPSDALAAIAVRRKTRHRVILQLNGAAIPGVSCHRWLPPEGTMFREALRRVDGRVTCSRFTRDLLHHHYGVDCAVIPPPICTDSAAGLGHGDSSEEPTGPVPVILSVADFNVRRKGVRVLVEAFCRIKRAVPSARLRLSGRMAPTLATELLGPLPHAISDDVEVLGLGRVEDLPGLYRGATITVLPAMWEPSGTVLFESFAAGTPVVATNHGGIPEFVTADVGVLFEPMTSAEETRNAAGLADAILEGFALARRPLTRERCRAHAAQYAWPVVGPQIERLYRGTH
jgi:phosphatidylinositol alpha-mannosyltransferase